MLNVLCRAGIETLEAGLCTHAIARENCVSVHEMADDVLRPCFSSGKLCMLFIQSVPLRFEWVGSGLNYDDIKEIRVTYESFFQNRGENRVGGRPGRNSHR